MSGARYERLQRREDGRWTETAHAPHPSVLALGMPPETAGKAWTIRCGGCGAHSIALRICDCWSSAPRDRHEPCADLRCSDDAVCTITLPETEQRTHYCRQHAGAEIESAHRIQLTIEVEWFES